MLVCRSRPGTLSTWAAAVLLPVVLVVGCAAADGDAEADDPGALEGADEDAGDPDTDPSASDADEDPDAGSDPPDAGEGEDAASEPEDADASRDDAQDEALEDPGPQQPPVDPAEVEADELGVVPVLMYHQLREDGGSAWDMSPAEFRAELVRLFDAGYVPIRTIDLARGEIDVPAGHRPVVLTFDDSTRSQASLDDDGRFVADSSVGILLDVAADYDHIEPVASFYVISRSLFGGAADGPDIVRALHDAGMEIGNHSHTHTNLRTLTGAEVQQDLATNVSVMRDIVPDLQIATFSLPLGIYPEDDDLAVRGASDGVGYHHEAVLQVGYTPASSPFHADFDGAAVARIQTHPDPDFEFGSSWWLDQLEAGGSWRPYVSDGSPDTISFPADRGDELASAYEDRANPY